VSRDPSDLDDRPRFNGNIRFEGFGAGSVDHLPTTDNQIELAHIVAWRAQASHVEGTAVGFNVQRGPADDLGIRIARLRAHGMGIRAIARRLGVHASTVSRRLRRAQHLAQHHTLRAEND
jgi:hypothetical protein